MDKFKVLKLIEIFCVVDDFCSEFEQVILQHSLPMTIDNRYRPKTGLTISEMMAIEIFYHLSGSKCFKYYYQSLVLKHLKSYFPQGVSYERFVALKPRINFYLFAFVNLLRMGRHTGIYFIDSTKLPVCHNLRIYSNKVFKDIAQRGKTSTGWFYGLKLHIVINHLGEFVAFWLTPGHVADNNFELVVRMCKGLVGRLFGDKGYISSKIFEALFDMGLGLFTTIRRNMKNKLIGIQDSFLIMKRGVVESVIDLLKSICNIDHTRHRSPINAIVNIWAAIAAYSFFDHKPSIISSRNIALKFVP